MEFFDQKQEVIEVKLTQFGKNLLARGSFKPVYYQFFDDDILYNSSCAGFSEHQNDTETRILKETPRLKTLHLTMPVSERYLHEEDMIKSGERERFEQIKGSVFPHIQERILLYPMSNQDVAQQQTPRFNLSNVGTGIKSVSFSALTGSGIQKKHPILEMEPEYIVREDRSNLLSASERRNLNEETFADITSKEVIFSDNSKLIVEHDDLILDIQELNCFTGLDNFHLNIYEVIEAEGEDLLIKLDTPEKVAKYFAIKTDEDVEEIEYKDPQTRNYYKRGET